MSRTSRLLHPLAFMKLKHRAGLSRHEINTLLAAAPRRRVRLSDGRRYPFILVNVES